MKRADASLLIFDAVMRRSQDHPDNQTGQSSEPPSQLPSSAGGGAVPRDPAPGDDVVRALLARVTTGVLATHSVRCAGYPFGSAAPFAVGPDSRPLFWFSELAEHTRNLRVDPRACLYVSAPLGGLPSIRVSADRLPPAALAGGAFEGPSQGPLLGGHEADSRGDAAAARVALLGKVTPVDPHEQAETETIYRARFAPPSGAGPGLGGFSYWRLDIERVRWIAGFGRMGWLTWSDSHLDPEPAGDDAGTRSRT